MSESPLLHRKPVGARPRVSMVVAWQGSSLELSRRLRAWHRPVDGATDVVVACACAPAEQRRLAFAHPNVRIMSAAPETEMHALRQIGVAAARGDIVMIFDNAAGSAASWREALPPARGAGLLPPRIDRVTYDRAAPIEDASLA